MKVRDVMTKDPITISPDDTVGDALDIFKKFHIWTIPVISQARIVGVVTKQDIKTRSKRRNQKIFDIMSTPAFTISPDTEIDAAVKKLKRERINALAVVDGTRFVGIVTRKDIYKKPHFKFKQEKNAWANDPNTRPDLESTWTNDPNTIPKLESSSEPAGKTENGKASPISSKTSMYKHPNKYIRWFFRKKYRHSRLRKQAFVIHLTAIICLSFLFWIIYTNSDTLDGIVIWIFKLGAIIQLILLFFIIRSIYKILLNLKYGVKGLANGYKLITAIVFVLFCFQLFLHPNIVIDSITGFRYDTLNPLEINWNYSNTDSSYNYGDNDNNQITIPEISNPKPVIDIQELELKIHELINNERQKNGISSLQYDYELADIARAHSQDMDYRNFFDHVNPDGDGPTERAIKAGYNVHKELGGGWYSDGIAENIHMGWLYSQITYGITTTYDWYTQDEIAYNCVNGWMNSPGHRQNILTSSYDKEGIGVSISSNYAVYVTQDFW